MPPSSASAGVSRVSTPVLELVQNPPCQQSCPQPFLVFLPHVPLPVQPRSQLLWFPAGSPQLWINPGLRKSTTHCDLPHPLGTGGGAEPRAAKLVVSFELFNYPMFFLYQGLINRAGMFEGFLNAPRRARVHLCAFSLIFPLFAHSPASFCLEKHTENSSSHRECLCPQ